MSIEIKILQPGDEVVLDNVASEVFRQAVDPQVAAAFLADSRHHIAVAIDDGLVVGFVSGVHYFHPDKPTPELFVNEVCVSPSHWRRGIAKALLSALFQAGREVGCDQAWVLTDRSNPAAMRLYSASGGTEEPLDQVMFSFSL